MLRVRRIKPTNNFVIVQEMKIKIRNCMKTRMNIEVLPTKDWRLLANCVKLSPSSGVQQDEKEEEEQDEKDNGARTRLDQGQDRSHRTTGQDQVKLSLELSLAIGRASSGDTDTLLVQFMISHFSFILQITTKTYSLIVHTLGKFLT